MNNRNDKCNCGSGKKYKKCCLNSSDAISNQSNGERKRQFVKLAYLYKDVPIQDFYELQQTAASEIHANMINTIASKSTHPETACVDSIIRISNGEVLTDESSFVKTDKDGITFPNYELIKELASQCSDEEGFEFTPKMMGNSFHNDTLNLFEEKLINRFGKRNVSSKLNRVLLQFPTK